MTFVNPEFLLIGIVMAMLVVLALWSHARRRHRLGQFLGGQPAVRRLSGSNLYRLRVERIVLLALAALAIAGAAAEPRWQIEPVPAPTIKNIVLAIDVSASMQASDVSPTRLAQAIEVAGELIQTLDGDRVGLLLFGGSTYPLAPPTIDHAVLHYFLTGLSPTMASAYDPGTLLSVGISEAATLVETNAEPESERAIVLIGDGETDESEAAVLSAVRVAADRGIGIHAIGMGTDEGGEMVLPRATYQVGGQVEDAAGAPAISRINELLLQRIAETGSGRYAYAGDDSELRSLNSFFEAGESAPLGARYELTFLFILVALSGLLFESLLDIRRPRRAAPVRRVA